MTLDRDDSESGLKRESEHKRTTKCIPQRLLRKRLQQRSNSLYTISQMSANSFQAKQVKTRQKRYKRGKKEKNEKIYGKEIIFIDLPLLDISSREIKKKGR